MFRVSAKKKVTSTQKKKDKPQMAGIRSGPHGFIPIDRRDTAEPHISYLNITNIHIPYHTLPILTVQLHYIALTLNSFSLHNIT